MLHSGSPLPGEGRPLAMQEDTDTRQSRRSRPCPACPQNTNMLKNHPGQSQGRREPSTRPPIEHHQLLWQAPPPTTTHPDVDADGHWASAGNSHPSQRGPSPSLHGGHAQGPPHVAGLAALHHHGADHVVPSRHIPLRELQRVQGEEDTVVDHPVSATEAGNADLRAQRADSLTNRPAHWP